MINRVLRYGNDQFTTFLLQSNNQHGATVFRDESKSGLSITGYGSIAHQTDNSLYGQSAIYFNGSDKYLLLPDNSVFDPGNNDFTIEFLWKDNGTPYPGGAIVAPIFIRYYEVTTQRGIGIYIYLGNIVFCATATIGTWDIALNLPIGSVDTNWNHYAVTRNGNNYYLFKNGIITNTFSDSKTIVSGSETTPAIGKFSAYSIALKGWMAMMRISNIARYTAAFSPYQRLFA